MHTGGGKQHGRIILRNQRSAVYQAMALVLKKGKIFFPKFFGGYEADNYKLG